MKKKSDIIIYATAIISCVLMILLLTTSNSISYNLLDEVSQIHAAETIITDEAADQTDAFLEKAMTVELNLNKENNPPVPEIQIAMAPTEQKVMEDTEIDNLILNILMNNDEISNRTISKQTDQILEIYTPQENKPAKAQNLSSINPKIAETQESAQEVQSPAEKDYHVVSKGEYLLRIASKYDVSVDHLMKVNYILDPDRIRVGQKLYLDWSEDRKPSADQFMVYRIKPNDTLSSISARHHIRIRDIIAINNIQNPNSIISGTRIYLPIGSIPVKQNMKFAWPVDRVRISSSYGRRRNPFDHSRIEFHKGLDLSGPLGTPIKASRAGKVIFSGAKSGYGNTIIIRHEDGFMSIYAHSQINLVKLGQLVSQGQVIAKMGNTGRSTGSHVHFEIRQYTKVMNPIAFLPSK